MACGRCGGSTPPGEIVRVENSYSQGGGYSLASFEGNNWYRGKHEGTSIWVVGRHTEHERLFAWPELAQASDYAKEHWPLLIEKFPTAELVQSAVESVYGV